MSPSTPPFALTPRVPGVPVPTMSPDDYAERTHQSRPSPAEALDETFWLASREQQDVQADGVHFGARVYWDDALAPYVSTGAREAKPLFRVRYDAASLAAGKLDVIWLDVWDAAQRKYQDICQCREISLVAFDIGTGSRASDATLKARARYQADLIAQRDAHNDRVMDLKAGPETAKRVAKDRKRRATSSRKAPGAAPRAAAPIFADAQAVARERQAALAQFHARRTAPSTEDGGVPEVPDALPE